MNRLTDYVARTSRWLLPKNDPDFLVIGAQKCGTSSLHYYLDQHPQLCGSTPKELHYFDKDLYLGTPLSEYRRHFRGANSKYHFESSPSYLYSPGTAENIKKQYPEIKMIVLLRDPVKRAYSAWNHYREIFETGKEMLTAFRNRARRDGNLLYEKFFMDRKAFPSFRECIEIEAQLIESKTGFEPALLRRGLYLQQLETYWALFSQEQILILGFNDLVNDTFASLGQVTAFLGAKEWDWSQINRETKNRINYSKAISEKDRQFLADYYAEPNKQLFERVGKLNW